MPAGDEPGGARGAWWRLGARLPTPAATVRIELAPRHVTLSRPATRGVAETRRSADCTLERGDGPLWQAPVAALENLLAESGWRPARAELVLSNHFVRYAVVPWRDDLGSEAERRAFVRHCFVRIYGAPAEAWELRLSETRYGVAAIASAVEPALLAALRSAIGAAALRLVSIEPLLAAAFNRVRRQIAAGRYWFAVAEPGRLCTAYLEEGAWRRLRCQPLDIDWQHELPRLLARERLLAGDVVAEAPLYLWAPALTGSELFVGSWTAAGLRLPPESGVAGPTELAAGVAAVEGSA